MKKTKEEFQKLRARIHRYRAEILDSISRAVEKKQHTTLRRLINEHKSWIEGNIAWYNKAIKADDTTSLEILLSARLLKLPERANVLRESLLASYKVASVCVRFLKEDTPIPEITCLQLARYGKLKILRLLAEERLIDEPLGIQCFAESLMAKKVKTSKMLYEYLASNFGGGDSRSSEPSPEKVVCKSVVCKAIPSVALDDSVDAVKKCLAMLDYDQDAIILAFYFAPQNGEVRFMLKELDAWVEEKAKLVSSELLFKYVPSNIATSAGTTTSAVI